MRAVRMFLWFVAISGCSDTVDATQGFASVKQAAVSLPPCYLPDENKPDGFNADYLRWLAHYTDRALQRPPSPDEVAVVEAIEQGAPSARKFGEETSAYAAAIALCLDYNQWSQPREWTHSTARASSLDEAMKAVDSIRTRDQVNALFAIATALARLSPALRLHEPLDDYSESAIGDNQFSSIDRDYVGDVQRVATVWRAWLDSAPHTAESLKHALVRARFNAIAFQHDDNALHFRIAPGGYLIDGALRATRSVGQQLFEATADSSDASASPLIPSITADQDVYKIPGVPLAHSAFRHNEHGTVHYAYIDPKGFDAALSYVAQTIDFMMSDESQIWEPSSLDVTRLTQVGYALANLLPFPGHGNWGLLYPLLQLILMDHGFSAQQSTGMDLMLMSCENDTVAAGYMRAWLDGSWAERVYEYHPNPMKNPLLRYVNPLRCRELL